MKALRVAALAMAGVAMGMPVLAFSLIRNGARTENGALPSGGVAWGSARACMEPFLDAMSEPPPYRVPSPYVFEEGRIHKGSESCKLTAVKELDLTSAVGEYVADCTTAHDPDWRRQYTIRIALDGDTLSMVWKSTASPQTYPFATGPLRRCNLQPGKGKLPWQADRTKG